MSGGEVQGGRRRAISIHEIAGLGVRHLKPSRKLCAFSPGDVDGETSLSPPLSPAEGPAIHARFTASARPDNTSNQLGESVRVSVFTPLTMNNLNVLLLNTILAGAS